MATEKGTYYPYDASGLAGNIVRITNAEGVVTGSFEYNAWGLKLQNSPPPEGTRYGMSAPAWIELKDDPDSGLLVTESGRVFMPEIGRFLQRDPLHGIGGSYAYAASNPLMFVDPDGMAQIYTNPAVAANVEELFRWAERWMAAVTKKNESDIAQAQAMIAAFQAQLNQALAIQLQWNKLDAIIDSVVAEYNNKYFAKYCASCPKGTPKLDPNLVKALMFTETQVGTDDRYARAVKQFVQMVTNDPNLAKQEVPVDVRGWYQWNLGGVTGLSVYQDVVKAFGIRRTLGDIAAGGNENDVRLVVGALMLKLEEVCKAIQNKNPKFHTTDDIWFNVILGFKGAGKTPEGPSGRDNANKVWQLYKTGKNPYGEGYLWRK